MLGRRLLSVSVALFVGCFAAPVYAQALKGAGTCLDEYKANKAALRAAKEKKADFITACRALPIGTPTPIGAPGGAASRPSDVGTYKTAGQCDDEYKQAKAALKAAKETKKEFVAACRSLPPGTVTPIKGVAAAPSAPTPAPSRAPAPAPTTTTTAPAPSAPSAPTGSNQFQTEAAAKGRCPSATVVWLNTKSKIYHFAGTRSYGTTKAGAYMCETDATASGARASLTEKRP